MEARGSYTRSNVRKNARRPKSASSLGANTQMLKRANSISNYDDEMPVWIKATVPSEFEETTPWLVGPGLRVEKDHVLSLFAKFDHFKRGFFNMKDVERVCNRPEHFYMLREVFKICQRNGKEIKITFLQFESHVKHYCSEDENKLSLQERIFLTLSESGCSKVGFYFSLSILMAIVASTTTFIIETLPSCQTFEEKASCCPKYPSEDISNITSFLSDKNSVCKCEPYSLPIFGQIEIVCMVLFTSEYLLRLLFCRNLRFGPDLVIWMNLASEKPNYPRLRNQAGNLVEFIFSTSNLIDLLAILPFYISKFVPGMSSNTRVLRVLRLARVFRVLKMGKYSQGAHLVINVCVKSLGALIMLVIFIVAGSIIFGSSLHFAETDDWRLAADCREGCYVRPTSDGLENEVSPWVDIPLATYWWAVVTLTTVGYGDFYPTTTAGKIVGTLCVFGGVLFLAPPITIIGANFAQEYDAVRAENARKLMEERQKRVKKRRMLLQKLLDKKETIESLKAKGFRGSFFNTEDRERASFFDLGKMGADERVANERSSFRGSFFGGSSLGRRLLGVGRSQRALDSLGTDLGPIEQGDATEEGSGSNAIEGSIVDPSPTAKPPTLKDTAKKEEEEANEHDEGNEIVDMAKSNQSTRSGANNRGRGLSIFREIFVKENDRGDKHGRDSLIGARVTLITNQVALGVGRMIFGSLEKEMEEDPLENERQVRYEDSRYETTMCVEKFVAFVKELYAENSIAQLCAEKILFELWLVESRVKAGRIISSNFTRLMLKSVMTWIGRSEDMLIKENSQVPALPKQPNQELSKQIEKTKLPVNKGGGVTLPPLSSVKLVKLGSGSSGGGGGGGGSGKADNAKLQVIRFDITTTLGWVLGGADSEGDRWNRVKQVVSGLQADIHGVKAGWKVVMVDGSAVGSATELAQAITNAKERVGGDGCCDFTFAVDNAEPVCRREDIANVAFMAMKMKKNSAAGAETKEGKKYENGVSIPPKRKKDCEFEVAAKMMALKWLQLRRAKSKAEARPAMPLEKQRAADAQKMRRYLLELASCMFGDVCEGSTEGPPKLSRHQRKFSVLENPQTAPSGLQGPTSSVFSEHEETNLPIQPSMPLAPIKRRSSSARKRRLTSHM
mmetsp:Transcript_40787/g.93883  ORF Transcript_40787/g.93883 Transcript_40787/m.93883 type:complete len:1129 (+) Transcript_40787:211-3597(+)|eukprot:CAMPEP_0182563516 /NCGR_PEP_ID=MMETSP1324-20130603/5643_1 /TAXON_ID=236786 /ORGANISM="Florenciella sp., Strain RCC1587" /LENGTH=1128 /DNA_ID=CAMNT_0024776743 /DNA_START=151 /DNA_END=3537 /DNA_ORIENTATION=+